jgi:hypothetical protein
MDAGTRSIEQPVKGRMNIDKSTIKVGVQRVNMFV